MTIEELCEMVMRSRPHSFMALNGAAAGIIGSTDSGSDALAQLQRATLAFADVYRTDDVPQLDAAKREVIAKTMVALTYGAITEEKADTITEAVVALTKGKN